MDIEMNPGKHNELKKVTVNHAKVKGDYLL